MATVLTYRCDVCGTQKGDSNHWFKAEFTNGRFIVGGWHTTTLTADELHLCGIVCAGKAMARAMEEKGLEEQ